MKHPMFVACTAAFAGVAVVLMLGASSTRGGQTLRYSDNGERWVTDLRTPLFDEEIRWVPGDIRESHFHVFNDADRDGQLRVIVEGGNSALSRSMNVSVAGSNSSRSCAVTEIAAGEKKLIEVVVSMADDAGNDTKISSAVVDIVLHWDYRNSTSCPEPAGVRTDMEGAQP